MITARFGSFGRMISSRGPRLIVQRVSGGSVARFRPDDQLDGG